MAVLVEWWTAGGAVHTADLEGVVHTASEVVRSRSAPRSEGTAPLAASLAVAQIIEGELIVAHVGNVAVLHVGQGVVTRVTRDHTLDRWLREATGIRWEVGERPPSLNGVSRAIGQPAVEVEITRAPLDARDVVVVASPGLISVLSSADVTDLVDGGDGIDATGTALLAVARLRSGERDLAVALGRVAGE
jgi:protein phosphatase